MLDKLTVMTQMKGSECMFLIFSAATRSPFVFCDPETFDDEVFLFLNEEDCRAKCLKLQAQKELIQMVRLEQSQYLMFYSSLFMMGVNALVVTLGDESVVFQLEEIVRRGEQTERKDGTVWVENPQLVLTAMYLMQEVRKNGGRMTKDNQASLEEIVANFSKGKIIQPMRRENKSIPLLKLPGGEQYQPIFTDIMEFQKFNRENQFAPLVIDAIKMPTLLMKEAVGVIINPLGVNMPLKIEKKPMPAQAKPEGQQ